jgi:hypothetical protein
MVYGRIMLESEIENLRQQEQILLQVAALSVNPQLTEDLRARLAEVRSERSSKEFQFAAKQAAGLVD